MRHEPALCPAVPQPSVRSIRSERPDLPASRVMHLGGELERRSFQKDWRRRSGFTCKPLLKCRVSLLPCFPAPRSHYLPPAPPRSFTSSLPPVLPRRFELNFSLYFLRPRPPRRSAASSITHSLPAAPPLPPPPTPCLFLPGIQHAPRRSSSARECARTVPETTLLPQSSALTIHSTQLRP